MKYSCKTAAAWSCDMRMTIFTAKQNLIHHHQHPLVQLHLHTQTSVYTIRLCIELDVHEMTVPVTTLSKGLLGNIILPGAGKKSYPWCMAGHYSVVTHLVPHPGNVGMSQIRAPC